MFRQRYCLHIIAVIGIIHQVFISFIIVRDFPVMSNATKLEINKIYLFIFICQQQHHKPQEYTHIHMGAEELRQMLDKRQQKSKSENKRWAYIHMYVFMYVCVNVYVFVEKLHILICHVSQNFSERRQQACLIFKLSNDRLSAGHMRDHKKSPRHMFKYWWAQHWQQ